MPIETADEELVNEWEQILKDAGLGMTVGERTDFLVNAGEQLELIIKYESDGKAFDYSLRYKRADERASPASLERNRQAGIKRWSLMSLEIRATWMLRWHAGIDRSKNALKGWETIQPEEREKCLEGLKKGRTKRWAQRTPKQKETPAKKGHTSEAAKKAWDGMQPAVQQKCLDNLQLCHTSDVAKKRWAHKTPEQRKKQLAGLKNQGWSDKWNSGKW